ncbi:MAG: hypothetical protein MUP85_12950 [Candidatus Lokiarchaeota archaeon]|nr:hypothetical protein [Candidatus Lokiarchaeota archaeon]
MKYKPSNRSYYRARGLILSCQTCNHYVIDDCYFSREEIYDIIKKKGIFHRKYRCEACGSRIDLLFNILLKEFIFSMKKVRIPLICCGCYWLLQNTHKKKRVISLFIYFIPVITIAIIIAALSIFQFNLMFSEPFPIIAIGIFFSFTLYLPLKFLFKIIKCNKFKHKMFLD